MFNELVTQAEGDYNAKLGVTILGTFFMHKPCFPLPVHFHFLGTLFLCTISVFFSLIQAKLLLLKMKWWWLTALSSRTRHSMLVFRRKLFCRRPGWLRCPFLPSLVHRESNIFKQFIIKVVNWNLRITIIRNLLKK